MTTTRAELEALELAGFDTIPTTEGEMYQSLRWSYSLVKTAPKTWKLRPIYGRKCSESLRVGLLSMCLGFVAAAARDELASLEQALDGLDMLEVYGEDEE